MKTLLVDDETAAQNVLRMMLEKHFPELQIVGTATSVPAAVKAIQKHHPHLIFLDINLPGQNGLHLMDYFDNPGFQIIFTTAYPEYALKAFELSAVAYLIKPLQVSKFKPAVERAIQLIGHIDIKEQFNTLKGLLEAGRTAHHKIALPVTDKVVFVNVEDIIYIEADGAYARVVTGKEKILLSKMIKEFEQALQDDTRFCRIHRSYIINIQHIKHYIKHGGVRVLMENGKKIPVAKERRSVLETLINKVLVGHAFKP